MPLYQHRFHGALPAGDEFVFSWWANSIRALAAAQAAAVAWIGNFAGGATGLASKCANGTTVNKVSTGLINPVDGRQQQLAEDVVFYPGTAGGSSLPQEVALVVSLRTALANRRGRGRFYLPAFAVSQVTAQGKVLAGAITDLMAALNTAWTAYNTALDLPVVYSRTNRASTTITSFDIGDLFDIQTRRDNKVQQNRVSSAMPI